MKFFATATADHPCSRRRILATLVGLGLLVGALTQLTACNKEGSVTFPQPPPQESMNWLFDVVGRSADDIWACGNRGAMFHYDGAQWTPYDMGTDKTIVKMYLHDDGNIYAVGHDGGIWRQSGASWSAMTSGTSEDLYGIGNYLGNIHATGRAGVVRVLSGSSWGDKGRNRIIVRDDDGAVQDTLYQNEDIVSLITVNYFGIGGAYYDPFFDGERLGIAGTKGMTLGEDPQYDWLLRPLSSDPLFPEDWIMSNWSDGQDMERNYLGSSEGWLYHLNTDNFWVVEIPQVTTSSHGGIRDIWMDESDNIYMATDEGQIVFQTPDYDFVTATGRRTMLVDLPTPFSGIWGSSPDNLYLVGFFEDSILHASYDPATGDFSYEKIPVVFPSKSAPGGRSDVDQYGLPLR